MAFVHAERAPPPPGGAAPPPAASGPASGLVMLALSASGILYTQPLAASDASTGPHILTDALQVPSELRGRVGACLHYSAPCNLLFTVYGDGRCYALRLNDAATEVVGGLPIAGTRVDHVGGA